MEAEMARGLLKVLAWADRLFSIPRPIVPALPIFRAVKPPFLL